MITSNSIISKYTTPAAKIISILTIILIIIGLIINSYVGWLTLNGERIVHMWLIVHLLSLMYIAFTEIKMPTCYKCGEKLKYKMVFEKHKCKKK